MNSKKSENFEIWLKNRLKNKKMTLSLFAEKVGVSRQGLYKIIARESDSMKYDTIKKIADVLEILPGELVGRYESDEYFFENAKPGFATRFIGDITFPDNAEVLPGEKITKIWRVVNVGTEPWINCTLKCVDPELPDDSEQSRWSRVIPEQKFVFIPPTMSGEAIDLAVNLTMPMKPGAIISTWKMADKFGKLVFPDLMGISCQVLVTKNSTYLRSNRECCSQENRG